MKATREILSELLKDETTRRELNEAMAPAPKNNCPYCQEGTMHAPGMCWQLEGKSVVNKSDWPAMVKEFVEYWGHE